MHIRCLMVIGIILLTVSAGVAQDYEVRLTRDVKAGETYVLSATGSSSEQMLMSAHDKIIEKEATTFSASLDGIVMVLEVNGYNQESKLSLLVSRFVASGEGGAGEQVLLPMGTHVVAQLQKGKKVFLVDGKEVSKDLAKKLGMFISLATAKATDDAVLGTKERKRVGDRWPVNSVKGAADLSADGIAVTPENINGKTMIEKMVNVDGTPCLLISAAMEIRDIKPTLPEGMTVTKSNLSTTFSGLFPVDVTKRRMSDSMSLTLTMEAKGKPAPDAPEITMTMRNAESTYTKLKPIP